MCPAGGAIVVGTGLLYTARNYSSVPAATVPGMAGDQVLGAGLVLRSGGQPSPDAAIAAGLLAWAGAGLPVLDDIKPAPLPHARALRGLMDQIGLLGLLGGKR